MDNHWEYQDWKPTMVGQTPWNVPTKKQVESYRDDLVKQTKGIIDVPYNAVFWLIRARTLELLGYPELAAGDAYKAIMLVDASMLQSSQLGLLAKISYGMYNWLLNLDHSLWDPDLPDDEIFILQERMQYYLDGLRKQAYFILCKCLKMILALPDLILTCQEALRLYPGDELFCKILATGRRMFNNQQIKRLENSRKSLHEKRDILSYGSIFARLYPWIPGNFQVRSKNIIDSANHKLKQQSKVLSIRESSTHGYGTFAKRAIRKGEILLQYSTPFGMSYEQFDTDAQAATQCYNCFKKLEDSETAVLLCCPSLKFCSENCKEIAIAEYHAALCGKEFSEAYNHAQNTWGGKGKAGKLSELGKAGFNDDRQSGSYPELSAQIYPSGIPLILPRFLAVCIQAGGHPLNHPAIAQLVPHVVDTVQYNEGKPVTIGWTFYAHVTGPIKILDPWSRRVCRPEI